MTFTKVHEHFLSTPHGSFYLTKATWIRCAGCHGVATVEMNYRTPWHWYECETCGTIDFYDAQWQNTLVEMPMA